VIFSIILLSFFHSKITFENNHQRDVLRMQKTSSCCICMFPTHDGYCIWKLEKRLTTDVERTGLASEKSLFNLFMHDCDETSITLNISNEYFFMCIPSSSHKQDMQVHDILEMMSSFQFYSRCSVSFWKWNFVWDDDFVDKKADAQLCFSDMLVWHHNSRVATKKENVSASFVVKRTA
jgi:hypothetical protein